MAFPAGTQALAASDSVAALFRRHGFEITSRRDAHPVSRRDIPACVLELALEGTEAGESVRDELEASGWTELLDRSADGPDGTQFAYRRDSILVEVAGAWQGEDDRTDGAARLSHWNVVVGVVADLDSERVLPTAAFNARLAAARDSSWAQAAATIAIAFVGGAECGCAHFSVESSIAPETTDEVEVTITRDGFLDDSIRGDHHRMRLRRDPGGPWQLESVLLSWRCRGGRGHGGYSDAPCR